MKDDRWHTFNETPQKVEDRIYTRVISVDKHDVEDDILPTLSAEMMDYYHDNFYSKKKGWHFAEAMSDIFQKIEPQKRLWHYIPEALIEEWEQLQKEGN